MRTGLGFIMAPAFFSPGKGDDDNLLPPHWSRCPMKTGSLLARFYFRVVFFYDDSQAIVISFSTVYLIITVNNNNSVHLFYPQNYV